MQEALDKHFNGENSLKERERQTSIINKQKKRERARQRLEEKKALKAAAAAAADATLEKQTEEGMKHPGHLTGDNFTKSETNIKLLLIYMMKILLFISLLFTEDDRKDK